MSRIAKIISVPELLPYILIGGIATLIDWSMFSISVTWFHLHYQLALLIGYASGGVFHYCTNKIITFKCRSKQLGSQLSIYILVGAISLLGSMGVLAFLVNEFAINKILARVLTTGIMLLPNYLLHKHISFSKKFFAQP